MIMPFGFFEVHVFYETLIFMIVMISYDQRLS